MRPAIGLSVVRTSIAYEVSKTPSGEELLYKTAVVTTTSLRDCGLLCREAGLCPASDITVTKSLLLLTNTSCTRDSSMEGVIARPLRPTEQLEFGLKHLIRLVTHRRVFCGARHAGCNCSACLQLPHQRVRFRIKISNAKDVLRAALFHVTDRLPNSPRTVHFKVQMS